MNLHNLISVLSGASFASLKFILYFFLNGCDFLCFVYFSFSHIRNVFVTYNPRGIDQLHVTAIVLQHRPSASGFQVRGLSFNKF